jgi:hypothetical protein
MCINGIGMITTQILNCRGKQGIRCTQIDEEHKLKYSAEQKAEDYEDA